MFVSGHPGSTSRLETPAQLEFERDVSLPTTLLRTSELRGGYIQYGRSNQSDMELVEAPLNSLENGIKVRRKLLDALHDDALISPEEGRGSDFAHAREPARARPMATDRGGVDARTRDVSPLHLH